MSKPSITFDKNMAKEVLAIFGYEPNRAGWIVDKKTRQVVPGLDVKAVHMQEFVGIVNTCDGPRLVRDNIVDLIKLADIGDR